MWTTKNCKRYDRGRLRYPGDLTDEEWSLVAPLIPPAKCGGNKRTVNLREVMNGIMYVLSTGCQWRAIPKDLPPRSTLFGYLDLWSYDGTLDCIHHALFMACREQGERDASPTAAIIDSQSVKSAEKGGRTSIRTAMTPARRSRARSAAHRHLCGSQSGALPPAPACRLEPRSCRSLHGPEHIPQPADINPRLYADHHPGDFDRIDPPFTIVPAPPRSSLMVTTGTNIGAASAGRTKRPVRAALRHANKCCGVMPAVAPLPKQQRQTRRIQRPPAPWPRRSTGVGVQPRCGYRPAHARPKRQLHGQPYMRTDLPKSARILPTNTFIARWRKNTAYGRVTRAPPLLLWPTI
jgi:transposase